MTKAELVSEIQNNLGGTSKEADQALAAVLDAIKAAVKKASKEVKIRDKDAKPAVAVSLVGFGSFSVARRNARVGLNPATGEKLKIKASKGVRFKVGAGLKGML